MRLFLLILIACVCVCVCVSVCVFVPAGAACGGAEGNAIRASALDAMATVLRCGGDKATSGAIDKVSDEKEAIAARSTRPINIQCPIHIPSPKYPNTHVPITQISPPSTL